MEENQVHKRRVRYKGTHPRKFEEKYKEQNPEKYADTIEKELYNSILSSLHLLECIFLLW